jgi:predicted transcriptional regulator
MEVLRIEIDDKTMKRLDKIAPARSRQRSAFVRAAIQRALWEIEELRTREAYTRWPDSAEAAYFDPSVWAPAQHRGPAERPRRR